MAQVLLDLTPLVTSAQVRGIGRYVRGLVQGLAELSEEELHGLEIRGLAASNDVSHLLPPIEVMRDYTERAPQIPTKHCDIKRSSLVTFQFARAARRCGAELVHLTEPRGVPYSQRPKVTVTAHDLIVLAHPQLYLPKIPGWSHVYRGLEHLRYAGVRRILAISEATKRDLMTLLDFPDSSIDVVYHGVDHTRFHAQSAKEERSKISALIGSDAPYLVYIGAGDARKDLDTLVRAHAEVSRLGVHLVFAGHLKPERRAALGQLVAELNMADRVHFLGFIADDLIPALYRQALLHVFPSRSEGFGLPVLEALACGAPTITSPDSALAEVAGGAAELVPCGQVDELAEAMSRVIEDDATRDRMRQQGLLRAAEFTWKRCAQMTVEFWRRSLAG